MNYSELLQSDCCSSYCICGSLSKVGFAFAAFQVLFVALVVAVLDLETVVGVDLTELVAVAL